MPKTKIPGQILRGGASLKLPYYTGFNLFRTKVTAILYRISTIINKTDMAITKAKLFETNQKRTAELMKALGHPARIAIIELLAERETCICGDITDELPLAQSTVSQHLKALKSAGIIKGEIDGVRVCYCLDEEGVREMDELFTPLVKQIKTATEEKCC